MIHLPTLNAILNSCATILIISGLVWIKKGNQKVHALCMVGATLTSVLFLISYLYYHFHHGRTLFPHQGWIRPVYFTILISHTILAVIIVPLILRTIYLARKNEFVKHRVIAKITFPIWLYVSVTGVVIYWMLYQIK